VFGEIFKEKTKTRPWSQEGPGFLYLKYSVGLRLASSILINPLWAYGKLSDSAEE